LKINRELYIKNYSKKFKITIIDFLINESNFEELKLNNKDLLIDFRDNLLDFQTNLSELSITEFFSNFIEKTGILTYIETH
jgi:hypothetical protein